MRRFTTTVREATREAINTALRLLPVDDVLEGKSSTINFVSTSTPHTFPHSLGRKPEGVSWLGEAASQISATPDDKKLWTGDSIVLRCDTVTAGILTVYAT